MKLPWWLRRDKIKLPRGVRFKKSLAVERGLRSAAFELDAKYYVPYWLKQFGVTKPDRYWIEMAHHCVRLDVKRALKGTKYDEEVSKLPVEWYTVDRPEWALRNFGSGKKVQNAAQYITQAKERFRQVRGPA